MHYQDETHLETNPYHMQNLAPGGRAANAAGGGDQPAGETVFGSVEAFGRGQVEVVCEGHNSACFLRYLEVLDRPEAPRDGTRCSWCWTKAPVTRARTAARPSPSVGGVGCAWCGLSRYSPHLNLKEGAGVALPKA